MIFGEHEQRRIDEALRRIREMDHAIGRSQITLLLESRVHEQLRAVNKVFEESFRASAQLPVRNAIEGIGIAAREAMEKAVALAVSSAQQAAIETLRATQFSKAHLDAWNELASIRNAVVHAQFAPSLAAE
jgi:hypothetical protein